MSNTQDTFAFLSEYPILEKGLELTMLSGPVWTGNKARLIQRYLRLFTYVTKHGTYIDLFSGPQSPNHLDSWAAKRVLETDPLWLRKFALFEKSKTKFNYINDFLATWPKVKGTTIKTFPGDANVNLPVYLETHPVPDKEATFCLMDQHTFECDWDTVKLLASHKKGGCKIELFYFLAQSWIDRAVKGMKIESDARLAKWWGDDGWRQLIKKPCMERGMFMAERFKNELGYAYAYAFPIFEKPSAHGCGKVMFYMIHASDHPEAPKLMVRAYNNAVAPFEPKEQLELELGIVSKKKKSG